MESWNFCAVFAISEFCKHHFVFNKIESGTRSSSPTNLNMDASAHRQHCFKSSKCTLICFHCFRKNNFSSNTYARKSLRLRSKNLIFWTEILKFWCDFDIVSLTASWTDDWCAPADNWMTSMRRWNLVTQNLKLKRKLHDFENYLWIHWFRMLKILTGFWRCCMSLCERNFSWLNFSSTNVHASQSGR